MFVGGSLAVKRVETLRGDEPPRFAADLRQPGLRAPCPPLPMRAYVVGTVLRTVRTM